MEEPNNFFMKIRNKPTISENANLAGSAGCTENLKENKAGKKEHKPRLSALEAAYCEYSWTPKKAAKSLLFYKQQPLTKVNKTNKDKTAFHSTVWSVCQF